MHAVGFKPYYNKNSEVLILGSFPSVKSRLNNFYYGNPLNRFWGILAALNNDENPKTIEDKKAMLDKNKIALYDVIIECDVEGSLDTNIKNPVPADLSEILNNCHIKCIITNGNLAKKLFIKNNPSLIDKAIFLPSTSSANTKFDKEIWINTLKNILKQ